MENISFLVNSTDDFITNSSLLIREFPYWQPTLAVVLFLLTFSQGSSILIMYVPLLVVLLRVLKKDHFKALNLLQASLVTVRIVEDIYALSSSILTFCLLPLDSVLVLLCSIPFLQFWLDLPAILFFLSLSATILGGYWKKEIYHSESILCYDCSMLCKCC